MSHLSELDNKVHNFETIFTIGKKIIIKLANQGDLHTFKFFGSWSFRIEYVKQLIEYLKFVSQFVIFLRYLMIFSYPKIQQIS